jgi:PAS domain S-box-containing protein
MELSEETKHISAEENIKDSCHSAAKSEEKQIYHCIFDNQPDAILMFDYTTGYYTDCNVMAEKLSGYSKLEILSLRAGDLTPVELREEIKKQYDNLLTTGRARFESEIIKKDNHRIAVEISMSSFPTENGIAVILIIRDIRKQKEREERLLGARVAAEAWAKAVEKRELEFRGTFENAAVGIAHVKLNGQWIRANNRLCEITGYPLDEFLQLTFQDITHPDDLEEDLRLLDKLSRGEIQFYKMEKRYIRKDGDVVWIMLTVTSQHDEKGKLMHYISVIEDISGRKRLEEDLNNKNCELMKINELLEDFIYIAAHDLRSPINNMILIENLMQNASDLDEKITLLESYKPCIVKLERILNGLIEIIQIQSEKGLIFKDLSFSEICNSVKVDLWKEIDQKGVEISQNFDDCPKIFFVQPYLLSIFNNFISNSIKYSREGVATEIQIETLRINGFVRLSFSDNGIGMDLERVRKRLFKPFERFTIQGQGTGVGLFIVKNIIEKNGGYIQVESKVNNGTTFHCFLKEYERG